eukprot:TRINITY_DN2081_c0_g1_i1.p1 TRINITY_DN2081_c0_g1~~TRINITY_DN2081_c0_g1_i1.p1  ORF type:complete len:191 (+),score=46.43 TRINITY_DN2081_c0_g1_i1:33-575(+)
MKLTLLIIVIFAISQLYAQQNACNEVKDETTCLNTTLTNGTYCDWCKSAAIPSFCATPQQAKDLPPKVKKKMKLTLLIIVIFAISQLYAQQNACNEVKDETTCLNTTLTNGTYCDWCKSAAIPSFCATPQQAKDLPPKVFECSQGPGQSSTIPDKISKDTVKSIPRSFRPPRNWKPRNIH